MPWRKGNFLRRHCSCKAEWMHDLSTRCENSNRQPERERGSRDDLSGSVSNTLFFMKDLKVPNGPDSLTSYHIIIQAGDVVTNFVAKDSIGRMKTLAPERILFFPSTIVLSLITVAVLTPLSFVHSLESKRLVYSNGASNALYIVWLGAIIFAHVNGSLDSDLCSTSSCVSITRILLPDAALQHVGITRGSQCCLGLIWHRGHLLGVS